MCSVNSAYLFSTPWSFLIRVYNLSKIVSHNCPVRTFWPTLFGLSMPDILLTHSYCKPFVYAVSSSCMPFSKSLPSPFLPTFQNLAEAPSSMEHLVPVSPPKRPILFLSASSAWLKPTFWHWNVACLSQAAACLLHVCKVNFYLLSKSLWGARKHVTRALLALWQAQYNTVHTVSS